MAWRATRHTRYLLNSPYPRHTQYLLNPRPAQRRGVPLVRILCGGRTSAGTHPVL
jgi:hypothetical protein